MELEVGTRVQEVSVISVGGILVPTGMTRERCTVRDEIRENTYLSEFGVSLDTLSMTNRDDMSITSIRTSPIYLLDGFSYSE